MISALESAIGGAAFVGAAAFIAGPVAPMTACVIGGTFALVHAVTRPVFKNYPLSGFACNVVATTALVNYFTQASFSAGAIAHITLLPLIALIKIVALGVLIVAIGHAASRTKQLC